LNLEPSWRWRSLTKTLEVAGDVMSGGTLDETKRETAVMTCEMAANSSPLPLPQSQDAMNGEILRRKVTIVDPQGLHMRPLAAFAQRAAQFQSTVTVSKEDQRVDGKSVLALMLLAAQHGTELGLEVSGPDAHLAVDTLAELLACPVPDDPAEPPLPKKG
jgi:phosphotransferase system HPr (HPr) family protein